MTERAPSATAAAEVLKRVLVVIVNFNGGESVSRCIESVLAQSVPTTIVVMDNGSSDGSDDDARSRHPHVLVQRDGSNPGFGGAVNHAVASSDAEAIVVLNPDAVLHDGCLEAMLDQLAIRPGVVGPVLHVQVSGSKEAGWTINHTGMPTVQRAGQQPLFVPGCVLTIDRDVFETVGGFDERYFLFVEDVELCWRVLLAGCDVSVANDAHATHEGGGIVPGGYLREGAPYRTSDLRVELRERNSMTLLLTCAPWWWLPALIPVLFVHTTALAVGAVALGRPKLAMSLLRGIAWNAREARSTLRRRHSLRRSSEGCRRARARLTTGPLLLRTIRDHGLPKIR